MTTAVEEEVWCEVSDDEMYNPGKDKKGKWEPKADDILKVFEQLKSKKVLDLHWKCPGRRHPDSDVKEEEETKEELVTTPVKQEEKKPSVPNKFDFDEDDLGGTKTVLTPRRTPGSVPKSQKKEAKMDKILKDMMQQRKLQAAEREARKLAGNKSPRTPASPGRARISSPAGSPRTPNRQSPVRVATGPSDPITTTPVRQSPVRIGAGPSDPITTTPVRQSPVRIGAGPSDPITTTPVRPQLDTNNAATSTSKNELNNTLNVANSKPQDNFSHVSTSQISQAQQSAAIASPVSSNNFVTQSTSVRDITSSQAVQREVTSQAVQSDVISAPKTVNQIQQVPTDLGKTFEPKIENTYIKTELETTAEKMDTS